MGKEKQLPDHWKCKQKICLKQFTFVKTKKIEKMWVI